MKFFTNNQKLVNRTNRGHSAKAKRISERADTRKGRHSFLGAEQLEVRTLMVADLINFVTTEHVDINLARSGGEWSIGPRNSDASPAIQYANDEAIMYVGSPAVVTRPASADFDFIGVSAGEDFYLLPQSQNSDVLYLGFAAYGLDNSVDRYNAVDESKGRVSGVARWAKAVLTEVRHFEPNGAEGNGVFSLWQSGVFGSSNVFMSSYDDGIANPNANGLDVTDGISSDDALWLISGGHVHYNFGFTEPGRYEVDLRLSAYFGDDGLNTPNTSGFNQSDAITVYFSVESVGELQFDADSYSVNEGDGTASIDVVRVGGSDGRIMVDYETVPGSALEDIDFTAQAGTLEFLDGELVKTITIPLSDDELVEGNESFEIVLSSPAPTNLDDYIIVLEEDANGLLGTFAITTVTIIDNDASTPTLVAHDDAFTMAGQELLQGSVTLNDDLNGSSDFITTIETTTAHGTLALQANGAFMYQPSATFSGSDSFTYRLNDLLGGFTTATATITGILHPNFAAIISDGHVDIGVAFADDAWDLHVHDEENETEYEPSEALLHVGLAALTTRTGDAQLPAYDFLGVAPDESIFILPETENPELPFLGLGTEELAAGLFQNDTVILQLFSVAGPGHFSMWQSGLTPDQPSLFMATSDGIDGTDRVTLSAESHKHTNFAFSEKGIYEITFMASGITANGATTSSEPVTYYFRVGQLAPVVEIVYARSTAWSPEFIDTLDGEGMGAGNGIGFDLTNSSSPLPWNNVNQLQIQFSEDVSNVSATTIDLRDSNGPVPFTVSYDAVTHIATIDIGTSLAFHKLRLSISESVTDQVGVALDGDSDNQVGGLFNFRFDILAGDSDGNGRVNGSDLAQFSAAFNSQVGQAAFDTRANWNGDNRVNGNDLSVFSMNFNRNLDSLAEPGAPFGGSGSMSRSKGDHDAFFAKFGDEDDEEDDEKEDAEGDWWSDL